MGGNDLKDEDLEPGNYALRNKKNMANIQQTAKKLQDRKTT